jgi:ribosomal-protein-alanine N-acetyltransferase
MGDAARVTLRPMRSDDLDSVGRIEEASFAKPWVRAAFEREFSLPQSCMRVAVGGDGRVVGYIVFWRVVHEIHLLDLAVAPSFRRCGVAGCLLDELLGQAEIGLAVRVELEVSAGNAAARAFYATRGFKEFGLRADYYGPGDDAVLLEHR